MSKWHRSDFRLDYSKVDWEHLPDGFKSNKYLAKHMDEKILRIEELEAQIHKLQFDLEADTYFLANRFLKCDMFPRFNGYLDFTRSTYYDDSSKYETFRTTMERWQKGELEGDREAYANAKIEDFIWLFFLAGGTLKPKYVVDYIGLEATVGGSLPPDNDYHFRVSLPETGKTYRVILKFYDIEHAIKYAGMYSANYLTADPFTGIAQKIVDDYSDIRTSNYGKILVRAFADPTKEQIDMRFGIHQDDKDSLVLRSFDPLEISHWLFHIFTDADGGLDILDKLEK